jgi:phosphate transport system substrate-binding protein
VKVLPLAQNGADYYPPTYQNVASAKYPLSRLVYVNTNASATKPLPPALKEFFAFILSKQGQQIVLDQAIFLPLQSWQAEASASLLR